MNRLAGKTCVITGAGSGIGRASALLFAREGGRVLVVDIDEAGGRETARLIAEDRGIAEFFQADVTVNSDVQAALAAAVRFGGRLDVLFNNAGGSTGVLCPLGETSEDEWDRVIRLNLKSVYLGCHAALPIMIEQGGGSIVNTASAAGLIGWTDMAAYCAAKGGVVLATKSMAIDYAGYGIRVNCVCPGTIRTPLIELNVQMRKDGPAWLEAMHRLHPLRRLGRPEEVAAAALFLASDESSFVTGAAVSVDGGYTAH